MKQFIKMLYSKPVILLLLCLTTTAKGFLQDEIRTARDDRNNVREYRLSMDRQLANSQNLPIRNADINRQINQKDKVVERLYDRRSFRTGTIESSSISRDVRTNVRDINNNQRDASRNLRTNRQNIRDDTRSIARNPFKDTRQVNNERQERRITPIILERRDSTRRIAVNNRRVTRENIAYDNRENRFAYEQNQDMRQRFHLRQTTNRRLVERDVERRSTREANEDYIPQSLARQRLTVRSTNNHDRRLSERRNIGENREQLNVRSMESRTSQRRNIDQEQPSDRRLMTRSMNNQDRKTSEKRNLGHTSDGQTFAQSDANREYSERQYLASRQLNRRLTNRSVNTNLRQHSDERREERSSVGSGRYAIKLAQQDRRSTERYSLERTRMPKEDRVRTMSEEKSRNSANRRTINQNRNTGEERYVAREGHIASSISRRHMRSTENLDRRSPQRRGLEQSRLTSREGNRERRERANASRLNSIERGNSDETRISHRDRHVIREVRSDTLDSRKFNIRFVEGRERSIPNDVVERRRIMNRQRSTERQDRNSSEKDSRRNTFRLDESRVSDRRRTARVSEQSRSDSTRNIRDSARSRDNTERNLSKDNRQRQRVSLRSENDKPIIAETYNPLTSDSRRYFEKLVSERTTRTSEIPTLDLTRDIDYAKNDYNLWANTAKAVLAAFLIGQILVNSSKAKRYGFPNSLVSMVSSVKEKVQ